MSLLTHDLVVKSLGQEGDPVPRCLQSISIQRGQGPLPDLEISLLTLAKRGQNLPFISP